MDEPKKEKAKKYKFSTEDKPFVEWVKRHFTSLTGRRAPFVYFGLTNVPYQYIFTNSDNEDLATYGVASYSVHVVTFKSGFEYLDRLHTELKLEDKVLNVRHMPNWMSRINTVGMADLQFWKDPTKGFLVGTTNPAELEAMEELKYESRYIMGYVSRDFQVPIKLRNTISDGTTWWNQEDKYIGYPVNPDLPMNGCITAEKWNLEQDPVPGLPPFQNTLPLTHIAFDGLSGPAQKEFVAKTKEVYTYERRWVFLSQYFCRVVSHYEDSVIDMLTIRPNTGMYVLYKADDPL